VRYPNRTFPWGLPLRRCVLALGVAVLSLVAPSAALSADWPEFHFAPDRSGFNPSETTLGRGNVAELSLSWRTTISAAPLTTPVVAAGRVYVGSNNGSVYALNAATGAILWRGATGASIPRSPAVAGDRVFVGSDDGKVYAFPTSCTTPCTPLWTTSTGGVSADPAVSNGVVFVGAFGTGLAAIDAVTGALLWTAPLSSALLVSRSTAALCTPPTEAHCTHSQLPARRRVHPCGSGNSPAAGRPWVPERSSSTPGT
jgi:PQQ-like domain